MRKLTHYKVEDGINPMFKWSSLISPWRACFNFLVIYLCRFVPSPALKCRLYRLTGMKVGRHVSVGLMAMFDIFFPHLIELGDNCVIGYNCVILAHEFLVQEWRVGPVRVGKNVVIGANSTVLAGVEIGDNSVVSACSLVNKDVPPGSFVGGVPARPIACDNVTFE